MNPRTTAILFALAAALGAFLYFYELAGEEERRRTEEAEKQVYPEIAADDVSDVWLRTTDDRDAHARRGDDARWQLVEPIAFPGDGSALDGMAAALAQMTSDGEIESPQALAVYGLGDGAASVRFRAGGADHELALGNKTPVGQNSYVSPDGSGRVLMVPTWRVNSLRKTVEDLRERRVLDFDTSAVERAVLRWPSGGVTLVRQDGAGEDEDADVGARAWQLEAPLVGPADSGAVDALLSDLRFLRAEGFWDDVPEGADTGLARPEFEAELTLTAGEGEEPRTVSIAVGSLVGAARYARGATASLYRIPAERLDDLPRDVVAYRFKELARFVAAEAQRFELAFAHDGGEPDRIEGRREADGWKTTPRDMAAGRAARLVSELARLDASDIVADDPAALDLAALGIEPPRITVTVHGGEGPDDSEAPVLAELVLGHPDSDAGIPARRSGKPAVYRVPFDLAEHIPVSLEAFVNRFLSEETEESGESGGEAAGELPPGLPTEPAP